MLEKLREIQKALEEGLDGKASHLLDLIIWELEEKEGKENAAENKML